MLKIIKKSSTSLIAFSLVTLYSLPFLASAQISGACKELGKADRVFSDFASCLVSLVSEAFVPYIFALTTLAFAVGVFGYVKNAEDESKRKDSLNFIIWGLVGMFFMITVWAFAAMFSQFFGVSDTTDIVIPKFK